MGGIMGGGAATVAPPPPASTRSETDVQAAAAAERERLRKMRGRASTILTGGEGDTSAPTLASKNLLGM